MIPKIIIQTWKTEKLPQKVQHHVDKLKALNKDFKYIFFSDKDIEAFIKKHYPQYITVMNNFRYNIQKIDLFRLIAIYHYGGFYFDIDMDMQQPLSELCKYDCVFPQEFKINGDPYLKNKGMQTLIGNYAFAASPKNDFIKFCIDNIIGNKIKIQDIPGKGNNSQKYIFYTTGPVMISDCYWDYQHRDKVEILQSEQNHRFGKYGRHFMLGSWK